MKRLKFLEDPEHPSLGPVVKFLKLTFMWTPNRTKTQTHIYFAVVISTLLLGMNQIVYMAAALRPEMFINFLQFSVYHIGVFKLLSYEIWRSKWEKIIQYIADIERDIKDDEVCKKCFEKYVKYVRAVMLFFFPMCTAANINVFGKAWLIVIRETTSGSFNGTSNKIFFYWWPSNGESKWARCLDMFALNYYGDTTSVYVLAWDCLVISLMVVFAGQLQVIRERFMHALDTDDEEAQRRNLVLCHKHYLSLLEHQQLLNTLLSPVMFFYLLLASSNLAITILKMFSEISARSEGEAPEQKWNVNKTVLERKEKEHMTYSTNQSAHGYNRAELMAAMQFLGALMTQLLFFYWHSNEVTVQSDKLSYGVFEANWVYSNVNVKKTVALLSVSTTKRLIFTAGPFNEMSLATFVSILRGSYSFYTLMSKTN